VEWTLLQSWGIRLHRNSVPSRSARAVPEYRFHNSFHAIQRVDLRNLSLEDIKNVVRYPGKQRRTKTQPHHGGHVVVFEKTVDGRTLKVVAEIKDSDCWLITAYESD